MIFYTHDEIFNMLATVSCETDLIELEHYILTNQKAYPYYDLILFKESIDMLYDALIPRKI